MSSCNIGLNSKITTKERDNQEWEIHNPLVCGTAPIIGKSSGEYGRQHACTLTTGVDCSCFEMLPATPCIGKIKKILQTSNCCRFNKKKRKKKGEFEKRSDTQDKMKQL